MSAPRINSSDVSAFQRSMFSRIGGRAYRGYVPAEIRIPLMRDRVAHLDTIDVAALSLGAAAVANYLREIGDGVAADRWDEMASDLDHAAAHRAFAGPKLITIGPWDSRGGIYLLAALQKFYSAEEAVQS